jgi:exosome complex RNA-binding protein Csl4
MFYGQCWECGNQLFYIRPEGHMCPNCGIYQSYD